MPDSINFAIVIPVQRVWGNVKFIYNPTFSLFSKCYDIVVYNQLEMQFLHANPRDYQHKMSLKNFQKQFNIVILFILHWHTVQIEAHFLGR